MTPKPKIFKPEDFKFSSPQFDENREISYDDARIIADIANRIIESKLGPKVYAVSGGMKLEPLSWHPSIDLEIGNSALYSGYVFNIQREEVKRECAHEVKPSYYINGEFSGKGKCRHCNIELTARWEAKK